MPNKPFIEDMLTLGSGILSNLMESRHELVAQAKQRAGSAMRELDIVSRDEFDAAFAMLAKARNAQEELSDRLTKIERHLNLSSKKSNAKKPVKIAARHLPFVKTKKKTHGKK